MTLGAHLRERRIWDQEQVNVCRGRFRVCSFFLSWAEEQDAVDLSGHMLAELRNNSPSSDGSHYKYQCPE